MHYYFEVRFEEFEHEVILVRAKDVIEASEKAMAKMVELECMPEFLSITSVVRTGITAVIE